MRWMLCCVVLAGVLSEKAPGAELEFGFARVDVTPQQPVRLSGYGNRAVPSEGVDTPLSARGMAMRADGGEVFVLLSVDTIGFTAALTRDVLEGLKDQGVSRSRFVVCGTHSHTAPHLATGLDNLFSTPLNEEERAAAEAYTERLRQGCIEAAKQAIANLQPGRLWIAQGTATFARNRRVLKDGVWTGFGENPEGPVDHSLPLMVVTDKSGKERRGMLFNYACHCTTFGGDYNRVNGDWAGYASLALEESNPGAVALCTIGCGADANPERVSARALEIAKAQGEEIADEAMGLLKGKLAEIASAPVGSFGFAGLPIDRPTVEELKEKEGAPQPQVRRHANEMLAVHERMGRLPETYPMPIQVWRFGDEFAMVFLGGEVVVDYAHRIGRELGEKLKGPAEKGEEIKVSPVWVTAYANDVFGYVASERMRSEGGYEVDYSMIYYMQPGRWSAGTEDVVLRRVHELFEQRGGDEPLALEDSLKTFTLPEGFEIGVVAAEPLIADPVNFTVDPSGRLWVVEMGDYPRGAEGESRDGAKTPWEGPAGGRVKILTDVDGDGRYDEAVTFLDDIAFPTGVWPHQDGAIISAAPDIIFARDTNGDGRADIREVLFSGFVESNPQHRINGFEWGLDGWLHLASGAPSAEITNRQGEKVNMSGRDLRIRLDDLAMQPVSGRSQYGRCRDDFGNWFGNTNSEPLFQFVIDDPDLQRNPFVPSPSPKVSLGAGRGVFPTSRTIDRFNDLHAANRFTSACGPYIFRDTTLGEDVSHSGLVCEPVHNLISRIVLEPDGVPFKGSRHPGEQQSEFLSSTDPWFRPVRMTTGPDRTLWVCDMYRHVIEHPQWIPEAWQAKINLYGGSDRGRIYRVYRKEAPPRKIPDLATRSPQQLVEALESSNGWERDAAQRLLRERVSLGDIEVTASIAALAKAHASAAVRTQALWTWTALTPDLAARELMREHFLRDDDARLVVQGIRALGVSHGSQLRWQPTELRSHPDVRVRYELALAAGNANEPTRVSLLSSAAVRDAENPWIRAAVLSSANGVAADLLAEVLREGTDSAGRTALVDGLVATALGPDVESGMQAVLKSLAPAIDAPVEPWRISAFASLLTSLDRRGKTLREVAKHDDANWQRVLQGTRSVFTAARQIAMDASRPDAERAAGVLLLGRGLDDVEPDRERLAELLTPRSPVAVQRAAIEALSAAAQGERLIEALSRLAPNEQAMVHTALLTRGETTRQLLRAVEEGEAPAASLSAATRSALLNHRDKAIQTLAAKLLEAGASDGSQLVSQYHDVTTLPGDATRGRAVFEKRCSVCHRLGDIGKDVGPKLSALQNKSSEALLTAILDPSRAVEAKYRACTVVTRDGRVHSGMIAEETATSVSLVQPDGKTIAILRGEIDELSASTLSFMPAGLEKDVTRQDLADVIVFVQGAE